MSGAARRRRSIPWLVGAVVLATATALVAPAASANDGVNAPAANYDPSAASAGPLADTPMMGFNDWARFECDSQAPLPALDGPTQRIDYSFQQFMEDQAKALSDTGLINDGYKTVTVDDCWMYRNSSGYLHGALNWGGVTDVRNANDQPGFDSELTSYVSYLHSLGARAGLYETSGTHTCSTATPTSPNLPNGSEGYEQNDANSFAYWGVDQLKYDNCGDNAPVQTLDTTMSKDLKTAVANHSGARNILFDISAPAGEGPGSGLYSDLDWVRTLGQTWRIGPDIWTYGDGSDPWGQPFSSGAYQMGPYASYDYALDLSRYQGPGNWNNPDMLLIGDNGMTTAEERSQMSLWSILGAPLVISSDARKFEPSYIASIRSTNPALATHLTDSVAILGNTEVIAVDQDALGAGGYRVLGGAANSDGTPDATSGFDVVVKPLADGSRAVVVLNKGASTAGYTLNLSSIGFNSAGCTYDVRDLWAHNTSTSTGSVPLSIASHDSAMLTVTPENSCGSFTPRGQITASRDDWGKESLCLDNYQAGSGTNNPVDVYPCSGTANQKWQMNSDGSIQLLQANATLCLTAQSGTSTSTVNSSDKGQFVGVAPCGSAPGYQTWAYDRDGNLKLGGTTASAGKCLDVYGGSTTTPTTPVDLYACGASPNSIQVNQTWAAPYSAPPAA